MFVNHNIPIFKCWLRREYLFNLEAHHGEFERVLVFAINSVKNRALGFTVMTDGGAQFTRLPISALVHKKDAPIVPFHLLQLWDNFSYDVSVIVYDYLLRCKTQLRDSKWYDGKYMFTVDWVDCDRSRVETNFSEIPDEHKCAHVIALDNGCFAAQPNNRILWEEPSFITNPLKGNPGYKTNTHIWQCEVHDKWQTSNDDKFFYGIEQNG